MAEQNAKQRIIEAGTAAIIGKSFNGCGLKEILDAAGVPKGSFYHYFKSKEDFGVAVVDASAEGHLEFTRERLRDRSKSPIERIRAYFVDARDHLENTGSQRQCLIAKVALEESRLSEPMRAAVKAGYDQWQVLLAGALREAQSADEVPKEFDPDQLATFMQNAWEGAMIRMEIDRDVRHLDLFIENILDHLLATESVGTA